MQVEQPLLLIIVPWLLVDRRIKVIIPSLSALLARADGNRIGLFQLLCDLGPIIESKLCHKTTDGLVLLTNQTSYITTPRLPIHIDFVQNLYLLSATTTFANFNQHHQRYNRDCTVHSIRFRTQIQRAYMLQLFKRTTKNQYYRPFRHFETEAAKQGPAFGVTPVLMPVQPQPSILLVFYHWPKNKDLSRQSSNRTFGSMFSLSAQGLAMYQQRYRWIWVDTILRNYGFFIEYEQSLHTSRAVEQLDVLERPWGFAKLLQVIPILQDNLFISLMKRVTLLFLVSNIPQNLHNSYQVSGSTLNCSLITLNSIDPTSAIKQAASLPLGSIIPKYKSYKVYTAPYLSYAVVPIIEQLFFEALTFICLASKPDRQTSSRIVIKFIIFVRLAISRFLQFRFPQRQRFSFISNNIQLFAETSGISVLSNNT